MLVPGESVQVLYCKSKAVNCRYFEKTDVYSRGNCCLIPRPPDCSRETKRLMQSKRLSAMPGPDVQVWLSTSGNVLVLNPPPPLFFLFGF